MCALQAFGVHRDDPDPAEAEPKECGAARGAAARNPPGLRIHIVSWKQENLHKSAHFSQVGIYRRPTVPILFMQIGDPVNRLDGLG